MGLFISRLLSNFAGGLESRVLLVGLDAAGKTTLLYKLKIGDTVTTIPTIGFNVENVQFKNINFTIWDIGGQDRIRTLWRHYFEGTTAVIYMVDSNDGNRLEEARLELHKVLEADQLRGVPVLVFANKQDLPKAKRAAEVTEKLGLHSLKARKWYCQPCSAISADGIYEGIEWLSCVVKESK